MTVRVSLPERLGHLVLEVDCFGREVLAGRRAPEPLWLPEAVANPELVELAGTALDVVVAGPAPVGAVWLNAYHGPLGTTADACRVYRECPKGWFRLTAGQLARVPAAWRRLAEEGAGLAVIHAREPGWSPGDEAAHSFRNVDINTYRLAVDWLVGRGWRVVRIGDASMRGLLGWGPKVYDLVGLRQPLADLYFMSVARLFLGCASGPSCLAGAFGVPCALANQVPAEVLWGFQACDRSIPKRVGGVSESGARSLMSLTEQLSGPVGQFRLGPQWQASGLRLMDNSPEEILELVQEVVCGEQFGEYGRVRELQYAAQRGLRPGHASFGAAGWLGSGWLNRWGSWV